MMARHRRRSVFIVLISFFLLLSACARPPEVIKASALVVRHATNLRQQTSLYADSVNRDRKGSEQRLEGVRQATQAQVTVVNDELAQWRLAKNKVALKLMEHLRADDDEIVKNPFTGAGFVSVPDLGRNGTFGRVKADTEAFDTLIKNISKLQKPRSSKELFEFALEIGKKVNDEIKALEKARKKEGKP